MNYGIGKFEVFAIVEIYKQWRYYIKRIIHCVVVITDHGNLQQFLIDKTLNCKELQ